MRGDGHVSNPGFRWRRCRGVVLVIVMLVVLGLSVVGAIIIEGTRMDSATAGQVRQATQSAHVSEVGTSVSLRVFASAYSGYKRLMTQDRRLNQSFYRSSFDTGVAGIPATLDLGGAAAVPPDPGSLAGYGTLVPDYAVLVDRPYEYGDSAGFSVSGTQGVSFCFRRYTFTTTGQVDLQGAVPPRTESRAMMRATSVVGPADCTL